MVYEIELAKNSGIDQDNGRDIVEKLFISVAEPDFEMKLHSHLGAARSIAGQLNNLYWSETQSATSEEIQEVELMLDEALQQLSELR